MLYWMTTFFNFLRISFLIGITIVIELKNEDFEWQWLSAYIYTISNCIILFVYIFGFSLKESENNSKI